MEIAGATTADVIAEAQAGRLPRETESACGESEPDLDLFRALIHAAVDRQLMLDQAIARQLAAGWRLERIDAVARAILRAGAAELEQRLDVPVAVVIDEYIDIAKAFFEGPEPAFINAALDACAQELRSPPQGA
jgi:N utilization substance protein B